MTSTIQEGRVGIKVLGLAGSARIQDGDLTGKWVKSYDPDARDGDGFFEVTDDPYEAMAFPSMIAAMEFWRQQSNAKPLRTDGRPNRPLTALSVMFEEVPS